MGVVSERPQVPDWSRRKTLYAIVVFMFMKDLLVSSAQRQGLSYACGAPKALTTSDGISWDSDAEIAPVGSNTTVVGSGYVRYFAGFNALNPQQNTHCYNELPGVDSEGPVLLRVTYAYSNYDGLDAPPEFQMWVGTAQVAYVNLKKDDPWIEEVIYLPGRDSTDQVFCMVAVKGAPVISFIELRPLPANSYDAQSKLLRKESRVDCGNADRTLRYPDDEYDRIWDKDQFFSDGTSVLHSNVSIGGEDVPERPPVVALNTSRNGTDLQYSLSADTSGSFSVKLYTPSAISISVQVNDVSDTKPSVAGKAIKVTTISGVVVDSSGTINVVLTGSDEDTPEINALEVFQEIDPGVASVDAESMRTIKDYYNLNLNWFGDPCLPGPWEGLQCSSDNQVTSLDLSGQNIALPIRSDEFTTLESLTHLNLSFNRFSSRIPDLTGLNKLEVLDLRNNDFSGTLDALSVLPALTQLFVSFNQRLSGDIPLALRRSSLRIDIQGTCIDGATGCNFSSPTSEASIPSRKSSNTGIIIGVIAALVVVAVLVVVGLCFICSRRKSKTKSGGELEAGGTDLRNWSAARVFSFKELETATHHFKKELGEGSFGPVYLGVLSNGQKVAIKMRQDTSQLGADAFANEVYLLSRVHHPNLVPLLGYCQEGKNQLLVYEYMPGGTLMDHLYGTMSRLDWVARLRIAIGAATGISYLHNESEPKIIHRDVKTSNILLDSNMTAKVSDFGLSKLVTKSEATHVTTLVKGTAGYLDPEYFTTNQLTEKSDVYSLGVVLLELICGREPLSGNRAPDEYNLIAWAKPYLVAKTYNAIVDRGLHNNYNPRSLSLVAALAQRCIERNSENRPTMLQVLRELEEALILEDRLERVIPSPSPSNSASYSTPFDFKSTASDTPPDSAPQLANVPSFTFPR